MFKFILDKIAWDYNQRELNKIYPLIDNINSICKSMDSLSDSDVKSKTDEFKGRIKKWESLDDILPEAFATVKQACMRMMWTEIEVKWTKMKWNMIPYDVQLIWWIVLHKWKISEMKTWEWKTLVATLPAYLNSLAWNWVHVVTVNDYLASRDAVWMWYLYSWLWVSVGYVTKEIAPNKRREMYEKDITYIENSELWFDFLRDNLVKSVKERSLIWRPLNFAIVDEVDSILIDEARTPLIISHASEEPTEKYEYYNKIVKQLIPCKGKKKVNRWLLHELLHSDDKDEDISWDYYIDEKNKTVTLSSNWIQKLEWILWVENLYKDLWYEEIHHIESSLKSIAVYIKDKDYIVRDNEVLIVDEHTGRVTPWRRYSEWLHQAIEAKEWVVIQRESQTLATITYQNFFKQYKKLAWMTGTAVTEGEEFEKIYSLEVLAIPTNKPILRVDKTDNVYFNQTAKWSALSKTIRFYHDMWLPMLIWTSSIQTSEFVSTLLTKSSIVHDVLNAKFHEKEAQIVSRAWKLWSVVVATNMAWRGTDIKLEDWLNFQIAENYCKWIKKKIKWSDYTWEKPKSLIIWINSDYELELLITQMKKTYWLNDPDINEAQVWTLNSQANWFGISIKIWKKWHKIHISPLWLETQEQEEINFHFWLMIIWTEKHDSRRIDNQLRWRSWRQWDPWFTQFFVALDDEIMRKIWWDKIQSVARLLLPQKELEQMELTQSQFTSSIERAQKQMEWWHFSIRKHLFDYDSVINKQRIIIYKKRDQILFSNETLDSISPELVEWIWLYEFNVVDEIKLFINDIVDQYVKANTAMWVWQIDELKDNIMQISAINIDVEELSNTRKVDDLKNLIISRLQAQYDNISWNYDFSKIENIFKRIYLDTIDKNWIKHIDDMYYLREKVWLFWYAQQDPLIMYKQEAYTRFQLLLSVIREQTLSIIFRTDFSFLNQEIKQHIKIIPTESNWNGAVVNMLKQAVQNAPTQKTIDQIFTKEKDVEIVEINWWKKAKVLEKSDDIEVLEIDESVSTINESIEVEHSDKKKLRPNDVCSCWSGKKYKKCHGKK